MLVLVASLLVLVIAGPALNPQVNQGGPGAFFSLFARALLTLSPAEINYAVSGTVDSKGRNGASVTQASIGTLQGVFASKVKQGVPPWCAAWSLTIICSASAPTARLPSMWPTCST